MSPLQKMMAAKAAAASTEALAQAVRNATGIASAPASDELPPTPAPVVATAPTDQTPSDVDWDKPVLWKSDFTKRIMCGGWFHPAGDGYYYPESLKHKAALENLAKTGSVTPENYTPEE